MPKQDWTSNQDQAAEGLPGGTPPSTRADEPAAPATAPHDTRGPRTRRAGLATRLGPHGARPASPGRASAAPEADEIPWGDDVAAAVAAVGRAPSSPDEGTDTDQRTDVDQRPETEAATATEDGAAALAAEDKENEDEEEEEEDDDDEIEPEDFAESFFWRSAVHDGPATPWRSLFS